MTSILEVEQLDTLSSNASSTLTIGGTNTTTIAFGPNVTTTPSSLAMTPAFHVRLTANQNVTSAAQTKVQFNDSTLDTNSCWDAVNYRFLPTVAGKYYIFGAVTCQGTANDVLQEATSSLRKNGTRIVTGSQTFNSSTYASLYSATVSSIVSFNGTTDYIEFWGRTQVSSGTAQFTSSHEFATYMGGYKIIGA
jgi:hypothetical protein